MSDPALVARRGILGSAVAAKASLYRSAVDRRLLFFLQGLSMQRGGINAVAHDIVEAFPERFDEAELPSLSREEMQKRYASYLSCARVSDAAESDHSSQGGNLFRNSSRSAFAAFLETLCLNVRLDIEQVRAERFCGEAPYVSDPIEVIEQFRQRIKDSELAMTPVTSLGRQVQAALDCALSSKRIVVVEAKSGSGKTHPTEAWCRMHQGEARYITLSGVTNRTSFFQAIGSAVGLGICQQASSKTQARVESFLASTRLMLVIDEAHFLWPQHLRSHSAPELVDWIDTMVNAGVPIALITTDQFQNLKTRAEKTGWTSDQFTHRVHRYFQLDSIALTRDDVTTAVRSMLSRSYSETAEEWVFDAGAKPDATLVKLVAARAFGLSLPLAAARAIVDAAQFVAQHESGTGRVSLPEVVAALKTQQDSDLAVQNAAESTPARKVQTPTAGRRPFSAATDVQLSPPRHRDFTSHTRTPLSNSASV